MERPKANDSTKNDNLVYYIHDTAWTLEICRDIGLVLPTHRY